MTGNQKVKAIVFVVLVVIATTLLASSLSQMDLLPGTPAPRLEGYHLDNPETAPSEVSDPAGFPFILRLAGILFGLYLLVALFSVIMGVGWKGLLKILREFSLIVGLFALLILVLFLMQGIPAQPARLASPSQAIEPPIFSAADSPPGILVWIVGIFLAGLAAILIAYWISRRRKSCQADLLAEQAEIARQNILAGENLDDVILRCYQEMVLIVQREEGIGRKQYTTPTEFERELCAAGLPQTQVHVLTHLFESVRYGQRSSTTADEQEALSNLQKITSYLRRGKAINVNE